MSRAVRQLAAVTRRAACKAARSLSADRDQQDRALYSCAMAVGVLLFVLHRMEG